MSVAGLRGGSLRPERAEYSRLVWALILSLAFHLMVYGTYQTGKRYHWWEDWRWPAWMQSPRMLTELLQKKERTQPRQQADTKPQPVPMMFVDVSPALAASEPPEKAAYYSDRNSRAANPDPKIDSNTPRIDGTQTQILRTEDVPKPREFPLQPAPIPPAEPLDPVQELKPEVKIEPAYTPGDLAMARPDPKTQGDKPRVEEQPVSPKSRSRPRTLKEALARPENSGLVGKKTRQEGGVRRRALQSSLDAVQTPFGAYDRAIVEAVQNRWYDLLGERQFTGEGTGKVVLRFNLNSDGSISQMKLVESTVDYTLALICQSAVRDPAPYGPWPGDMKRLVGADHREVTFTFYYY
jgi:outer membrane biosynthesis protein TonB